MKRILITGKNGYIGTNLAAFLSRQPSLYAVESISLRDRAPDAYDFHGADAIVHLAAIVHRKETQRNRALYDAVNRDLAIALAEKAKREGVKQFVFMSTMSVYGMDEGTVTKDTLPDPKTAYGRSKLEAERAIAALAEEDFTVTVLRAPVVFGPGAKGNPARLERLAKHLPFCPTYENRRTAVSIETLCGAIESALRTPRSCILFPQEPAPVSTCTLLERIQREQGKPVRKTKLLNPLIRMLRACTRVGKKAFGDLVYQDLTELALSDPYGEEAAR